MRVLRPLIAVALSLMLAFTSLGLAFARGQAMAGGQIVLCTGAGPVTVTLDAQGNPTGHAHICPDMALGLIVALGTPDPVIAPSDGRAEALVVALPARPHAEPRPTASARDPPVLI
jgi:hypothetical protein